MNELPEFYVRPARAGDHAALLVLSSRLTTGAAPWRDPAAFAAAARGWIETSLARAGDDGHAVLVAMAGDRVAGLVSLAERQHFTAETDAYIGELVTDGEMEGQGAGRALLAAAEKWAADRGLARITLDTGARNYRARYFYQKYGFEEEDIRYSKAVGPVPAS